MQLKHFMFGKQGIAGEKLNTFTLGYFYNILY